jgi:hypothetical protein
VRFCNLDDPDRRRDARVSLWTVLAVVLVCTGLAIGWWASDLPSDRYRIFLEGVFGMVDRRDVKVSRNPLTGEGMLLLLLCSVPLVGYVVAWVAWVVRSPAVGRFSDMWKLVFPVFL